MPGIVGPESFLEQFTSNADTVGKIEPQESNGDASYGRSAYEVGALPAKVADPFVAGVG